MGIINTQLITATAVAAGDNIPVGNVIHRSSCKLSALANAWKVEGAGFYKITANVTLEPVAAGDMVLTLSDNGTTIAQASSTVAAAADATNITLIAVIYNKCGCNEDTMTITAGSAATVTESDVIIERM